MSNNEGIIIWTERYTVRYNTVPDKTDAGIVEYSPLPNTSQHKVYFGVYPRTDNFFAGKIKVTRSSSLPMQLTVAPYNRMEGELEVYGVGDSRLKSSVTVRTHSDIDSVIRIPPRNRMTGIIDIQPIPRTEEVLYPVKDAFYRSGVPRINYGREQSMSVGRITDSPYSDDGHEILRSVLQFDLSHLPKNVEVEKAVLRLYPTTELKQQSLRVYNNLSDWSEDTVAWVNQPNVSDEFVEGETKQGDPYIEINVLDLVKKWTENKENNYGFQIRLANEEEVVDQSFFTREFGDARYRPQLEIRYFDRDLIVSIGRVPLRASITVKKNVAKNLKARIRIKSYIGYSGLPSTITVVNPNYRVGNITVSRPFVQGTLPVRQFDPSVFEGRVTISNNRSSDNEWRLTVNKNFLPSKLTISTINEVPFTVTVASTKHSNLGGKVEIIKNNLYGKLTIKHIDLLDSVVYIPGYGDDGLLSSVLVNKPSLPANIEVRAQNSLEGRLVVPNYDVKDLKAVLTVSDSSNGLVGNIEVVHSSLLPSTIIVNSGNLSGTIYIPGTGEGSLDSVIKVSNEGFATLKGIVTIKHDDLLSSIINVKSRSYLKGKIKVVHSSLLPASIFVSSGNLPGRLAIPDTGTAQFTGRITVNVRMINELKSVLKVENPRLLPCIITIRTQEVQVFYYAFIM